MIDYQRIKEDLALPEFSQMTDAEFVEARNEKTIEKINLIPKTIANNFIIANFLNTAMRRVIAMPVNPNGIDYPIPEAGGISVREAAQSGIDFLMTDTGYNVDGNNPNTRGLISILVGAGVWTQQQSDDFFAMFKTYQCPSELEYGSEITERDVRIARLFDKANQLRERITELQYALESIQNGDDVNVETIV